MTPTEKAQALVDHGLCDTFDEAVHMLADMGDIDSSEHEEMLSDEEAARVYGDRALHGHYHCPDCDAPIAVGDTCDHAGAR